jgi:hypothetical protein
MKGNAARKIATNQGRGSRKLTIATTIQTVQMHSKRFGGEGGGLSGIG